MHVSAWDILQTEYPDLAEVARQNFYFSRNQEQSIDEAPFYTATLRLRVEISLKNGTEGITTVTGEWNLRLPA